MASVFLILVHILLAALQYRSKTCDLGLIPVLLLKLTCGKLNHYVIDLDNYYPQYAYTENLKVHALCTNKMFKMQQYQWNHMLHTFCITYNSNSIRKQAAYQSSSFKLLLIICK